MKCLVTFKRSKVKRDLEIGGQENTRIHTHTPTQRKSHEQLNQQNAIYRKQIHPDAQCVNPLNHKWKNSLELHSPPRVSLLMI